MNITIKDDGTVKFEEDLIEWARMFHGGRFHTVKCAGTRKQTEKCGAVGGIKVEIIQNNTSDDSDLEKWLERNGV